MGRGPDRRDRELRAAASTCGPPSSRSSGTGSSSRRSHLRRPWASAGPPRGAGTASTVLGGIERPIRVSTVERLEDAHLLHAGLATLETDGRGAGVATALGRAARDRGIGDFWGYMLVAQGLRRCDVRGRGQALGPRRARAHRGRGRWTLHGPGRLRCPKRSIGAGDERPPARRAARGPGEGLVRASRGWIRGATPSRAGGATRRGWGHGRGTCGRARRPGGCHSAPGCRGGMRRRPPARSRPRVGTGRTGRRR